jgi:UDP-N-acetylglucosamine 1-carboxyvinyltransferase
MGTLLVTGGVPLTGTITVSGSRSASLQALVAGLYSEEPILLHNVPTISDVEVMFQILREFGADISYYDHSVTIRTRDIVNNYVSIARDSCFSSALFVLGPLLNTVGEVFVPVFEKKDVGECFAGLRAMGATIEKEKDYYHAVAVKGLKGVRICFNENTVSGTAMLLLAAVGARGESVIENAAQEPEIDDLISLLNAMGAKVERVDLRTIRVVGVTAFHAAEHTIGADRSESVLYLCAALASGGEITIRGLDWMILSPFLSSLDHAGWRYEILKNGVRVFRNPVVQATSVVVGAYPAFSRDYIAPWCALMTGATGETVIGGVTDADAVHYIQALQRMGAPIETTPSQEIRIYGPCTLVGGSSSATDVSAGMAVFVAALGARGESTISGIEHCVLRFEDFLANFLSLGAHIELK